MIAANGANGQLRQFRSELAPRSLVSGLSGIFWDDFSGDLSKWSIGPYNADTRIEGGGLRITTDSAYTGIDHILTFPAGDYRMQFTLLDQTAGHIQARVHNGTTSASGVLASIDTAADGPEPWEVNFTSTATDRLVRIQRRSGVTDVTVGSFQIIDVT